MSVCKDCLVFRLIIKIRNSALGIAVESPQLLDFYRGARTCNGKPDPCGNAIKIKYGINK